MSKCRYLMDNQFGKTITIYNWTHYAMAAANLATAYYQTDRPLDSMTEMSRLHSNLVSLLRTHCASLCSTWRHSMQDGTRSSGENKRYQLLPFDLKYLIISLCQGYACMKYSSESCESIADSAGMALMHIYRVHKSVCSWERSVIYQTIPPATLTMH